MNVAPVSPSQRTLLDALKRRGRASVPQLAADLKLNIETIRDHLKTLGSRALVRRDGVVRSGPGRPEVVYTLTGAAEALFPRREGEILRALGGYLLKRGHERMLRDFFEQYVDERRNAALARVAHLEGTARVKEVARIFSELGFMPVVESAGDTTRLRLCHCPLRDLVHATKIPCGAEMAFLSELLGDRPARVHYLPDGDMSCTYEAAGAGGC
ncbi:MAG: helix-turn-helix domain-containing protein [Gemmatimonadaceae bacterium]|nr:helix-turn-helix domain-containing protein [Gemmatimonadaceae bacterium]